MQLAQIEGSVFQEMSEEENRVEDKEHVTDRATSNSHDEGLSAACPYNLTLLLWYHEAIADTAFGS